MAGHSGGTDTASRTDSSVRTSERDSHTNTTEHSTSDNGSQLTDTNTGLLNTLQLVVRDLSQELKARPELAKPAPSARGLILGERELLSRHLQADSDPYDYEDDDVDVEEECIDQALSREVSFTESTSMSATPVKKGDLRIIERPDTPSTVGSTPGLTPNTSAHSLDEDTVTTSSSTYSGSTSHHSHTLELTGEFVQIPSVLNTVKWYRTRPNGKVSVITGAHGSRVCTLTLDDYECEIYAEFDYPRKKSRRERSFNLLPSVSGRTESVKVNYFVNPLLLAACKEHLMAGYAKFELAAARDEEATATTTSSTTTTTTASSSDSQESEQDSPVPTERIYEIQLRRGLLSYGYADVPAGKVCDYGSLVFTKLGDHVLSDHVRVMLHSNSSKVTIAHEDPALRKPLHFTFVAASEAERDLIALTVRSFISWTQRGHPG